MNEEVKERLDKIDKRLDDFETNHLSTIESWILYLADNVDKLWKCLGLGIAFLAIVIALVHCFG